MKKKTKFLIETSAVRPVLGMSTVTHCKHVSAATADGENWTSIYIRMEFIRVWVCGFAQIAFTIAQSSDVADALYRLEQDFSIRKVKSVLAGIASHLKQTGSMTNSRSAAEEVASLAVDLLRQFDEAFTSKIPNNCGCEIGGSELKVDFNNLMLDLHEFYNRFSTPIQNCDVNIFLQINKGNGRASKLLEDEKFAKLTVGKNLAKLKKSERSISCKECSHIGDAVIGLEQPKTVNLVHIDGSFNEICRIQGMPHTLVKSIKGVDGESSGVSTP